MSRINSRHLSLLAIAVSLAACSETNKATSGGSPAAFTVAVAPSFGLIPNAQLRSFKQTEQHG